MNKTNINYIGQEFNKVKEELQNKGMRTKKTIFDKKIKIGYDEEKNLVYLECEINEIDLSTETIFKGDDNKIISLGNTKETIDHKEISKYYTLSISGYSKNFGGQIYDELKNLNGINKSYIETITKVWKEWHLNDMQPNCIHQKAFNCNKGDFTKQAEIETKKCPKGYKYGSKWLIKELPTEVIKQIQYLFTTYKMEDLK